MISKITFCTNTPSFPVCFVTKRWFNMLDANFWATFGLLKELSISEFLLKKIL
jgi:hypothetical protein